MAGQKLNSEAVALLKKVASDEGFQKPEFLEEGSTNKGDNYVGVIHRVKMIEKQDGSSKSDLRVIIKSQPENVARRKNFQVPKLFWNEAVFYNEVIPEFANFQKIKGITRSVAPSHARCLYAGDLLILEDQTPLGFLMSDRRQTLDHAHCLLIMRELGRLHAVSFALRDQKPEVFKRLTDSLSETLFCGDAPHSLQEFFATSSARTVQKFDEVAQYPMKKKYFNIIKNFQERFFQNVSRIVRPEVAEPFAVICHGDCWTNNILFKYFHYSNVPERACLLDFQLTRYASPACEIAYFLFCCTGKPMRDEHYHKLLHEYHASLGAHLAAMGSNVDTLFPWTAFQAQMREFGSYGLALALITIPMFTSEADDIPDLDDVSNEENGSFADQFSFPPSSTSCWERVGDVIVDVVDLGYMSEFDTSYFH